MRGPSLVLCLTCTLLACSDDGGSSADVGNTDGPGADLAAELDLGSGPDQAGVADSQPPADSQPAPDSLSPQAEQEPNNGSTATEYNSITLPALVSGAIGTAGDFDLFGLAVTAGQRLVVTVKSDGDLQPHVTLFEASGAIPTALNPGSSGEVMVEYYVLEAATLIIAVRDRRNTGSSPQNVGGQSFGYTMSVAPLSRSPLAVTVGGSVSGSLDPPGTVRVYQFSATQDDELDLAVTTQAPSTVDSRLSLFFPAKQAWLGTNDDATMGQSDSLLQGKMPFSGTYHAIVENVADQPAGNLGFSLSVTATQP